LAAKAVLEQAAQNRFPRRALGIAREIAFARADVVGLQEATRIELNGVTGGLPFIDYLEETLEALERLGLHYEVAATVENIDINVSLDLDDNGTMEAVRLLDRDVTLVKRGIDFSVLSGDYNAGGLCGFPIPNPADVPALPAILKSEQSADGCNFSIVAQGDSPVGPITIDRGFVGIDLKVRGENLRIINTHFEVLEPSIALVQSLQAVELVGTLLATTPPDLPLAVIGDFNSSPEDLPIKEVVPPYQILSSSGFNDVWNSNRIFRDGYTCCQRADLANRRSLLDIRIDQIWMDSARLRPVFSYVSGRLPLLSVFPPYWASDHGGVVSHMVLD
jgi:endonuclease/exonuclease/phosphatase family metal-dependent hydrolase